MDRLFGVFLCAFAAGTPVAALAQSLGAPGGPFVKERAYAELSRSQVERSAHEYIAATRGWDPSQYRLNKAKDRRVPVVYIVTYLAEEMDFVDGGRVFEIHLDAETARVVGENPLTGSELSKAVSSMD